jgi:type II secretory pathway pseudopilin PulG
MKKTTNNHFPAKNRAFTLVEVLVLVAVLALIFSIVFGSASSSRKTARIESNKELGSVVADSNLENTNYWLPVTATNIIDHGNDWWEFTLNDNRWLYHSDGYDSESLVLIPKKIANND